MSEVRMLTGAMLLARRAKGQPTQLDEVHHIDDRAAEILSRYGGPLDLRNLRSLSDRAAEHFSQHHDDLLLDGLTEVSTTALRFLSEHPGLLSLGGLQRLDDEAAELLGNVPGHLFLDGVQTLSDNAAAALGNHVGFLGLTGLESLSPTAAQGLANNFGILDLSGLKQLSGELATALGRHRGGRLALNGLASLSVEAADGLSRQIGGLDLDGLTRLTDGAAEALSDHRGGIALDGLHQLSASAATSLGKQTGGGFFNLRGLIHLSAEAAGGLSAFQGDLYLGGLGHLSDEAAAGLGRHRGKLGLSGLRELSDSAAARLHHHVGVLYLNGLTTLSETAAYWLGSHQGELRLMGLKGISETAAMHLSRHRGPLDILDDDVIPDTVWDAFLEAREALEDPDRFENELDDGANIKRISNESNRNQGAFEFLAGNSDRQLRLHDVGPRALENLFTKLGFDASWSVREPRGFTWWGHDLAQRVWVEPPRWDNDVAVCLLHAETAVFRNVPNHADTYRQVADWNRRLGGASALIYKPKARTIVLHCTAYLHPQNADWMTEAMVAPIALQAFEAHQLASQAHALAEVDATLHPTQGRRRTPDQALQAILERVLPAGWGDSRFQEDFDDAQRIGSRAARAGATDRRTAVCEFDYARTMPAISSLGGRVRGGSTALLEARAEAHPTYGNGCRLELNLPIPDEICESANALNLAESTCWTRSPLLGAWTIGDQPRVLTFRGFLPNVMYRPGMLANIFLGYGVRTRWVREHRSSLGWRTAFESTSGIGYRDGHFQPN